MAHDEFELGRIYDQFDRYISRMPILAARTRLVGQALRRLQDTRTAEHERPDGMFLFAMWELEEEAALCKAAVYDALHQLVEYHIIRKTVIRAKVDRVGELWLSKISIASLEQAELSGDIPQQPIKPVERCRECGEVHIKDITRRACSGCGADYELYRTDHGLNYDYALAFFNACLQKRSGCHVLYGILISVNKAWFWQQEQPGMKKPMKGPALKRILHELGIEYKETHTFRRFEGVGLTPYAQALLENNLQEKRSNHDKEDA